MARDADGLAQSFDALLKDDTFSDVTLVVGGRRMPAHRVVLAARSDYFKTMFTIDLAEKQSRDVILNDTSPAVFQSILNYAYTGTLDVKTMGEQMLLEVLELSHRYQFPWVQNVVATHLAKTVTINTVCERLNAAELLKMENLKKACLVPTLTTELLRKRELASNLSHLAIESVLALNDLEVPEIDRFQAVCGWIEKHKDGDARSLLSHIRLSLFTMHELYYVVCPTNHYSERDIIEALFKRGSTLELRDLEMSNSIKALELRLPPSLPVLAIEPRRQTFDSSNDEFIMAMRYGRDGLMTINTVQLELPSHLDHYSYEVDVSSDYGHSWSTVCSQDHCEKEQALYIAPQHVSHLRIRFSTGTVKQCTPLTVKASYSDSATADFNINRRCRAPKHNVATATTARFWGGYGHRPDELFGENMKSYASFPLNNPAGSLVVRFLQPYYVSSLIFLLGRAKCKVTKSGRVIPMSEVEQYSQLSEVDRWYSYYVEVSDDNITWNRVCDKSAEDCSRWQVVRFAPQRIVYVRIVGTRSIDDFFRVTHFECPIDEARLPQLLEL